MNVVFINLLQIQMHVSYRPYFPISTMGQDRDCLSMSIFRFHKKRQRRILPELLLTFVIQVYECVFCLKLMCY